MTRWSTVPPATCRSATAASGRLSGWSIGSTRTPPGRWRWRASPQAVLAFQALFKRTTSSASTSPSSRGWSLAPRGRSTWPWSPTAATSAGGVARTPDEGRPAVTHYRVVEHFGPVATLLACWLETGRTHQIRIHLAEIGHPVVGDAVYRPRQQPRTKARFPRQALHAQTLGFVHPLTGEHVHVEAPLPDDFSGLINDLRNRYGEPG